MPPTNEERRERALAYLPVFFLTPYFWGGDDFAGIDCSGLMIKILQAVGSLEQNYDTTAHGLWTRFRDRETQEPRAGALVFWFNGDTAVHVEMLIDRHFTIGASGGGRPRLTYEDTIAENPGWARAPKWWVENQISLEEARRRAAFVQMHPLTYRGPNYRLADPFAETA